MTARVPFEYAVLRAVPRVERGESINAGVVVYCRDRDFLGARIDLDVDRLRALDPQVDVDAVHAALEAVADACRPDGTGPAAELEIGARFRWVTAPRSTIVQAAPVHTGLTSDPAAELDRLLAVLVARPSATR
jgi:hypothetical protein